MSNFIKVHKKNAHGFHKLTIEHGGKTTTFDGLTTRQADILEKSLLSKYHHPKIEKINKKENPS